MRSGPVKSKAKAHSDASNRGRGVVKSLKNNDSKNGRFERGELVWVRIKGFPWWPGITVDETDVPEKLRKVWICS